LYFVEDEIVAVWVSNANGRVISKCSAVTRLYPGCFLVSGFLVGYGVRV